LSAKNIVSVLTGKAEVTISISEDSIMLGTFRTKDSNRKTINIYQINTIHLSYWIYGINKYCNNVIYLYL